MAKQGITFQCEAEVAEGLEAFARNELTETFPQAVRLLAQGAKGSVRFAFNGNLRALDRLKTIESVFLVISFAVPRPRALLGDANLRLLRQSIDQVLSLYRGEFQTLYLSAAGADSSVMTRIKQEIAASAGLGIAPDKGDLLLRIRPSADRSGWEVLIRLTPRPLSARAWRVCNYEAALNATVAHAIVLMTRPKVNDVVINLGSGSGTLLIERMAAKEARAIVGIDHSLAQMACAGANINATGRQADEIQLVYADMLQSPLPNSCADALLTDLPFGQNVGSHEINRQLYPQVLAEAARLAKPNARFIVITHEIKLMETLLRQQHAWGVEQILRVTLRGLHPAIYQLKRTG